MVNLMNIDEEGCFDDCNKIFSNNYQTTNYKNYNDTNQYDKNKSD